MYYTGQAFMKLKEGNCYWLNVFVLLLIYLIIISYLFIFMLLQATDTLSSSCDVYTSRCIFKQNVATNKNDLK